MAESAVTDPAPWMCRHYCPHGARCRQSPGHDGLHDSRRPDGTDPRGCTWTDDESIPEEEADRILAQTPKGELILTLIQIARMMEEWDETW